MENNKVLGDLLGVIDDINAKIELDSEVTITCKKGSVLVSVTMFKSGKIETFYGKFSAADLVKKLDVFMADLRLMEDVLNG